MTDGPASSKVLVPHPPATAAAAAGDSNEVSALMAGFESSVIPTSIESILQHALDEEDKVKASVVDVVAARFREEEAKADRTAQMTAQRARRDKFDRIEASVMARLKDEVEAVQQAIRERHTSLKPDGLQQYTFPNGDTYTGHWKNAHLHNQGLHKSPEFGQEFEGEWFLNARVRGKLTCEATATTYVGSWLEGRRSGRGQLIEAEGAYDGEFRNGRFHTTVGEESVYDFRDGHRYRGEWSDGRFHGHGAYNYPTNGSYIGEWSGGLEHGVGTRTSGDGDQYQGEWLNGKRHGRGTLKHRDFVFAGEWRHGVRRGAGKCTWHDGTVYEGEYLRDHPHGRGTWRRSWPVEAAYEGQWYAGHRHGRGRYQRGDVTYDGEWRENVKHGDGVASTTAGALTATWVDDLAHGPATFRPSFAPDTERRPHALTFDHGTCTSRDVDRQVVRLALRLGKAEPDHEEEAAATATPAAAH